MADVAALTAEQKRILNAYHPSLGVIKPGFDIGKKLDAIISLLNQSNLIVSGSSTVPSGAAFIDVAVGAAYDGKPIVVTIAEDPTNTVNVKSAVWDGAGTVRISLSGDPGISNADVFYIVDGR